MADAKKQNARKDGDDEGTFLGGPLPQDPPVADVAEDPAPDPAVTEDVKPPKGAYIEDLTQPETERMTDNGPMRQAHPFADEFAGVGGRYVVDPETGERKPVYEKYIDADGETKYRKAP